jgi:predicted nucleic acid-binding protein
VSFVLDASMVFPWYMEDEARDDADRVLERLRRSGAVVPAIWPSEMVNAMVMAARRGRMTEARRDDILRLIRQLPVEFDTAGQDRVWSDTLALADGHRLTIYDATYLELAKRRGLPLASLDSALIRAAAAEKVPTLPA